MRSPHCTFLCSHKNQHEPPTDRLWEVRGHSDSLTGGWRCFTVGQRAPDSTSCLIRTSGACVCSWGWWWDWPGQSLQSCPIWCYMLLLLQYLETGVKVSSFTFSLTFSDFLCLTSAWFRSTLDSNLKLNITLILLNHGTFYLQMKISQATLILRAISLQRKWDKQEEKWYQNKPEVCKHTGMVYIFQSFGRCTFILSKW